MPGDVEGAVGRADAAILVVDDDPSKRVALAAVLRPLGYMTIEAESGVAALREVTRRTFAVILMDVLMPEMDGYETARLIRMRRESEHTPIIFVTAYARDEAQIPFAYASGAVDFIFAPVVPDILRAKVSIFVEMFLRSSELRHARAQLELNVARLKELDRLKEEFVAIVTHELRTPLTSVAGYLDLALETDDDLPPLDEQREHCIGVARRNTQRLIDLVEDLLLVRGVEAGREVLARVPVAVSRLAAERLESVALMARGKDLTLVDYIAPDLVVEADERRLAQVIDNLLANAIKYTPPGGLVQLDLRSSPGGLELMVTDTGIGIPAADQPMLFDPFFRATNVSSSSSPGTGLGLSVTRLLVEALGGTIGFESTEGSGSCFTITMPLPVVPLRLKEPADAKLALT
jgi:signal transduction histidine kinase